MALRSTAALGAALAAGAGAGAVPAEAEVAPRMPDRLQVELAVNAERATWHPHERGRGTLVLDDVGPRMAVMAIAPRREATTVPTGMLAAEWSRLFGRHGGHTNIVVSYETDEGRRLAPMRVRLVRSRRHARRLVLAVTPLDHTGHRRTRLPARRPVRDVTVLVDPSITEAIIAMWNKLVAALTLPALLPEDPVYSRNGRAFYVGEPYAGLEASYDQADGTARDALQRAVLDAAGPWSGTVDDMRFEGADYAGVAIFNRATGGDVTFRRPDGGRIEVSNTAVFNSRLDAVTFSRVDADGLNLRGTNAAALTISGSAIEAMDVTGAKIRGGTWSNSVLERVVSNRSVSTATGPDFWSQQGLAEVYITGLDVVTTEIRDSALPNAELSGVTFQACNLERVDLRGASITGAAPVLPDEPFAPTFDSSSMTDVRLDGARLKDVSFAGVDFSGGGVSLDGATLDNVDFTGAIGLDSIDWSKVDVAGPVYGLWEVSFDLILEGKREYLRSFTTDGVRPGFDEETGYDVLPEGLLVDPASGVRFQRDTGGGNLVPWDPVNDRALSAYNGDPLEYDESAHKLVDPEDLSVDYEVNYETGEIR